MAEVDTTKTVTKPDLADGLVEDVGSTFGRYTLMESIGAGGMGVVFRARDPALARDLAIKVVRAAGDHVAEARLLREAQAMARLRGDGVVPVYDVGVVRGGVFIVMPYLAGGTLGRWLRRAPRAWPEVLDRFVAAGRGLALAHAAGLVHRDFKPDNVLLDDDGRPMVADFGLARAVGDAVELAAGTDAGVTTGVAVTAPGARLGTPAYMAPEQVRGDPVDARADVFAFCVSLYEGLYGQRPFEDGDSEVRTAVPPGRPGARSLRAPPSDRRAPGWLRAAVVRGLAAEPADRWPTMEALLAHVARRRRRPRRVAVLAAGLVAAAAIAAVVIASRAGARPATRAYRVARLTARGDVSDAALGPDGRHLAMVTTPGELIVRDLDSAGDERVVAGSALWSAWSADGHLLVYLRRDGELRALHLPDGAETAVGEHGGYAAVVGAHTVVNWRVNLATLTFVDVRPAATPRWTCTVPGTYRWLDTVVPLSDGTLLVGTKRSDAPDVDVDRVVHLDTRCRLLAVVADDVRFTAVARVAHGDRLVAERAGPPAQLIELDRGGAIRVLDAPVPERSHQLLGIRPDGSVIAVEREASWRLVRAGPGHPPVELAAGALQVVIAMAPRRDRFALLETRYDGAGGALRVVDLATPRARGPALEARALAVGWRADGELVAVVARDGGAVLVGFDAGGRRRREHPVPRPAVDGQLVALDGDEVAYVREDSRTYVAVDVGTGATRTLFEPALGYTHDLSRSPRDGSLLVWWRRRPAPGTYRIAGDEPAEWLPISDEARPLWSRTGDAVLAVSTMSPRIDRFDLATRASTPYVTDLGARGTIGAVAVADGDDLFVQLDEPNADVFARTPAP